MIIPFSSLNLNKTKPAALGSTIIAERRGGKGWRRIHPSDSHTKLFSPSLYERFLSLFSLLSPLFLFLLYFFTFCCRLNRATMPTSSALLQGLLVGPVLPAALFPAIPRSPPLYPAGSTRIKMGRRKRDGMEGK